MLSLSSLFASPCYPCAPSAPLSSSSSSLSQGHLSSPLPSSSVLSSVLCDPSSAPSTPLPPPQHASGTLLISLHRSSSAGPPCSHRPLRLSPPFLLRWSSLPSSPAFAKPPHFPPASSAFLRPPTSYLDLILPLPPQLSSCILRLSCYLITAALLAGLPPPLAAPRRPSDAEVMEALGLLCEGGVG